MFMPDGPRFPTLHKVPLATIDAIVSARLGITRVKGNAQPAVFNRQIAMYLAKHVGGWSTTAIGKYYNGRHHTTVLWALQRVEHLRSADLRVAGLVLTLQQEIQSHLPAEPDRRSRHGEISERQFGPTGLDDKFLEMLTDKIAERLKSRGVCCLYTEEEEGFVRVHDADST